MAGNTANNKEICLDILDHSNFGGIKVIIEINPPLDGIAAERFIALSKQLTRCQQRRTPIEFDDICSAEVSWSKTHPHLNGYREIYEACSRVLIDLARLSWEIRLDGYTVQLHSPNLRNDKRLSPEQIQEYKKNVRKELSSPKEAQLRDPAIQRFIYALENPGAHAKRESVLSLIADGRELYNRLKQSNNGFHTVNDLKTAVKPYLQLVPEEGDPNGKDKFTGIPLRDIWRYFRYTWVIPQMPIPGRQLYYLVRDASHPFHAIMGIAQLSNCAMQMRDRDNYIGWTYEAFLNKALNAAQSNDYLQLNLFYQQLIDNIEKALDNIDNTGLVTASEIENPTLEIVSKLRRISQQFAQLREGALKELSLSDDQPIYLQETENLENLPVSDELLALEGKKHKHSFRQAQIALIAKKRAFELSRLLHSRYTLESLKHTFINPTSTAEALKKDEFQTAINTALIANKSTRIGTNMLEITTCGAVKPYNELLSGKLTALLMLSPQVINDYKERYVNEPSIISSQLKNTHVYRDSTLVYLGTTSLYSKGSSQYNRLRLPAKTISPEQPEISFKRIGYTSGFGTVQFRPDTVRAVERVLENKLGYQNVNSVFGEGPSPRFRKLNAGLAEIGFNPEALMRHNQQRIIYGIPLCNQSLSYLLGEQFNLPDYIKTPQNYLDSTDKIVDYWLERWFAGRIKKEDVTRKLLTNHSWSLSKELPVPESVEEEVAASVEITTRDHITANPNLNSDLNFWRSLANAGLSVCADEFSEEDVNRIHVSHEVERFILNKVREGYSIVLTGNAGDGKTHLLRRLESKLTRYGAKVQPDATAVMRHGDVTPIINEWRQQLAVGKPYCLAANEYPLYELREQGQSLIPLLKEVDRQCKNRLVYGPESEGEEAQERVIVIDLSLRNPLAPLFVRALLLRLLEDQALLQYAESNEDLNFSHNFSRLSHPVIQVRLLDLFNKLVTRGHRSTIRELWIILAKLIFGNNQHLNSIPRSPNHWYSEILFEPDDRFALSKALRENCDPYMCSHPQWDRLIESTKGFNATDWIMGNEPLLSLRLNANERFKLLKRLFYFENRHGEDAFNLEDDAASSFKELLDSSHVDITLKKKLIETINLCYCPLRFNGMKDSLYLWMGHRFHEKPTRSYVANQSIPTTQLEILKPRLPKRLLDSIEYLPDHFILRFQKDGQSASLRVDYSLYSTLLKINNGLPRHLVPERDANTMDVFLEQLQAMDIPQEHVFVAFNAEQQSVSRIHLSSDWSKYLEVAQHE